MTTSQATVRTWGDDGGSVLLDDGTLLSVAPQALVGSPFRFLRPGQRVRLTFEDGRVVRLDLP